MSLHESARRLLMWPRSLLLGGAEAKLAAVEQRLREHLLASVAGDPKYADPRCLSRHGYRIHSQNDEDGIIDEVFRRIGTTNREFVEIGVGNGTENNTVALLAAGWRGLWIEADPPSTASIERTFADPLAEHTLRLLPVRATVATADDLLEQGGAPSEPDLLSVDIDGNDYWVWKSIRRFRPRVVVIEYNASLGRTARVVRPYDPSFSWDGTSAFGASLGALAALGAEKGYALVGCNLVGVNAFFVRTDCLGDHFLQPYAASRHYEPPRYGVTCAGHPLRWSRFEPV